MSNFQTQISMVVALILACCFAGGCRTTTPNSRAAARAVAAQVADHKATQIQRIETVNKQFEQDYDQLVERLVRAVYANVSEQRDSRARLVADELVAYDDSSLPGRFQQTWLRVMGDDLQAIIDGEKAIEAAKADYQAAYKQLVVKLDKLDAVRNDLILLSAKESDYAVLNRVVGIAVDFSKKVRKARQNEKPADG